MNILNSIRFVLALVFTIASETVRLHTHDVIVGDRYRFALFYERRSR